MGEMGEPCSSTPVKNETDGMEVTVSNRQPLPQTPTEMSVKLRNLHRSVPYLEVTPF